MDRLVQAEADAGDGPPDVEKVLEAFLAPMAEMAPSNPTFVRLMGRMLNEGMMRQIVERHFHESAMRFVGALARALPHLGREELMWRVHFMIGAMAHTMTAQPILPLTGVEADFQTRIRLLVRFLSAAFRAPAEGEEKT